MLSTNPRGYIRVFIVGGGFQYVELMHRYGYAGARRVEDADFVLFTGGEDVTPELYGERALAKTHSNRHRDDYEVDVYNRCKEAKKPMVGICRGGQFLNVMNGGKLWQHVVGHTGDHVAFTPPDAKGNGTRRSITVTSTHHQMMEPTKDAVILLSALEATERHSQDTLIEGKDPNIEDVEVCIYPDTDSLCFQPHPEFHNAKPELVDFFEECLEDWIEPMVVLQKDNK